MKETTGFLCEHLMRTVHITYNIPAFMSLNTLSHLGPRIHISPPLPRMTSGFSIKWTMCPESWGSIFRLDRCGTDFFFSAIAVKSVPPSPWINQIISFLSFRPTKQCILQNVQYIHHFDVSRDYSSTYFCFTVLKLSHTWSLHWVLVYLRFAYWVFVCFEKHNNANVTL